MRRRAARALTALLPLVLSACAVAAPAATPAPRTLVVGGSGAAYPVLQLLAKEYRAAHPSVSFEFRPSSTTGAGLQLVAGGELDIAGLGRDPTADENVAAAELHFVANDAVVLAVHPSVTIASLTTAQLRDVYSGKIRRWEQVGGTGGEIVLVDRPEDETAKIAIRRVLGGITIDAGAASLAREADMVAAVQKTPGAIGYFSASYILEQPDRARVVAIDGVRASLATIADGTYPVVRKIGFAVKPGANGAVRDFIAYAESAAPRTALESSGYVPYRP